MRADSSVISISMLGLDALYQYRGLQLKGQAIYSFNKNVEQYNQFGNADLGKEIFGYYLEAAYNLLATKDTDCRLSPFVRYENFDTQYALSPGTVKNPESHRKVVVAGLSYYPTPELVLKADMQWIKTDSSSDSKKSLNIGFGFMF